MVELQSGRAQNVLLADGDTVFVPKAETFFVTGFVNNGGPFLHEAGMTVSKAISMAGGITEKGSRSRIRITRVVDGKQVVHQGRQARRSVQPGDLRGSALAARSETRAWRGLRPLGMPIVHVASGRLFGGIEQMLLTLRRTNATPP